MLIFRCVIFILFVNNHFFAYNNHTLMIFNLRALSYLEGTTTNDSRGWIFGIFYIRCTAHHELLKERKLVAAMCRLWKTQENILFFITLPFLFISLKVNYWQRGMDVSLWSLHNSFLPWFMLPLWILTVFIRYAMQIKSDVSFIVARNNIYEKF